MHSQPGSALHFNSQRSMFFMGVYWGRRIQKSPKASGKMLMVGGEWEGGSSPQGGWAGRASDKQLRNILFLSKRSLKRWFQGNCRNQQTPLG